MKKTDKQKAIQIVAEEDELEEKMPDNVWAEIAERLAMPYSNTNSREYIQELMGRAIKTTKADIIKRIAEL